MKKISAKNLRMLIEQEIEYELAHDKASDIVPVEDAFAGGENLVQPLVQAAVVSDEIDEDDIPKSPEMLSLIERAYVMDEGRVIFSGTPDEMMRAPLVIEHYLGRKPAK